MCLREYFGDISPNQQRLLLMFVELLKKSGRPNEHYQITYGRFANRNADQSHHAVDPSWTLPCHCFYLEKVQLDFKKFKLGSSRTEIASFPQYDADDCVVCDGGCDVGI